MPGFQALFSNETVAFRFFFFAKPHCCQASLHQIVCDRFCDAMKTKKNKSRIVWRVMCTFLFLCNLLACFIPAKNVPFLLWSFCSQPHRCWVSVGNTLLCIWLCVVRKIGSYTAEVPFVLLQMRQDVHISWCLGSFDNEKRIMVPAFYAMHLCAVHNFVLRMSSKILFDRVSRFGLRYNWKKFDKIPSTFHTRWCILFHLKVLFFVSRWLLRRCGQARPQFFVLTERLESIDTLCVRTCNSCSLRWEWIWSICACLALEHLCVFGVRKKWKLFRFQNCRSVWNLSIYCNTTSTHDDSCRV